MVKPLTFRTAGHCAALHGVAPSLLRGLLAYIARYYTPTGAAPELCSVCGATWACEHRPALRDTADMDSLSAEDARRMVERQIAARALPADGQHCARCGRSNVLLLPAMVDGLPRWLCGECRERESQGGVHEAAAGYRAA
jgi:ribosomal protein S27AE